MIRSAEQPEPPEVAFTRNRQLADYYAAMSAVACVVFARHDVLAQVSSWFDARRYMADQWCASIFAACVRLSEREAPINDLTLALELQRAGRISDADRLRIHKMLARGDFTNQHFFAEYNCRVAYEHWRAATAVEELSGAEREIVQGRKLDDVLDYVAAIPNRLPPREQTQLHSIHEAVHEILDELDDCAPSGWSLGLQALDRLISPMRPGTLVVVAAPTGGGKSVFMGQAALRMATQGRHALVFSLEMPARELIQRWAAARAHAPLSRRDEIREAVLALQPILTGPDARLHVRDASHSIEAIESVTVAHAGALDVGLVVVDYLQLVKPDAKIREREQQVADISRRLKQLAMRTQTVLIAGSQFNRAGQDKPELRSLRESGAIEQDADVVILMKPDAGTKPTVKIAAKVAKNRHGEQGSAILSWDRPCFTIRDVDEHDIGCAVQRHAEFDAWNEGEDL